MVISNVIYHRYFDALKVLVILSTYLGFMSVICNPLQNGIIGCFGRNDSNSEFTLNLHANNSKVTPYYCSLECLFINQRYSAVINGSNCFCGQSYKNDVYKFSENCSTVPCAGNSNIMCGSMDVFALYDTQIFTNTSLLVIPQQMSTGDLISVSVFVEFNVSHYGYELPGFHIFNSTMNKMTYKSSMWSQLKISITAYQMSSHRALKLSETILVQPPLHAHNYISCNLLTNVTVYCDALVYSMGKGNITWKLGSMENVIQEVKGTDHFSTQHYIHYVLPLSGEIIQSFPSGSFVSTDTQLSDGIYALYWEFYAIKDGAIRLKILRPCDSNDLNCQLYATVWAVDVVAAKGHNTINIDSNDALNIKENDTFGFEYVNNGGRILFVEGHQSWIFNLSNPILFYFNVQLRLIASKILILQAELGLTQSRCVDVSFNLALDNEAPGVMVKQRAILIGEPSIFNTSCGDCVVLTNDVFDVCFDVGNTSDAVITFSSTNSSVYITDHIGNKFPLPWQSNITCELEGSGDGLRVCQKLIIENDGKFNILVDVESAVGIANTIVVVDVIPPMPDIVIDAFVSTSSYYQLQEIIFSVDVTIYSGPVKFTWDFGDGNTFISIGNSTAIYSYLNKGNYRVVIDVDYLIAHGTADKRVLVKDGFYISGDKKLMVGTSYQFNLLSRSVYSSSWQYKWDFSDGSDIVTATNNDILKIYNQAGDFTIINDLVSQKGVIRNTFTITVYEPITGLTVGIVQNLPVVGNRIFSLIVSRLTGNDVGYSWTTNDTSTTLVSMENELASFIPTESGRFVKITLVCENYFYSGTESIVVEVKHPVYNFTLCPNKYGLLENEMVEFTVSHTGGFSVSYKVALDDNLSTMISSSNTFTQAYTNLGTHYASASLLIDGSEAYCELYSDTPCNVTVTLYVQRIIDNVSFEVIPINGVIMDPYVASGVNTTIILTNYYGTMTKYLWYLSHKIVSFFDPGIVDTNLHVSNVTYHHEFSTEGNFNLTVFAINEISWKMFRREIILQKAILSMDITNPGAFVAVSERFVVDSTPTDGGNVTYLWSVNDFRLQHSNSSWEHIIYTTGLYSLELVTRNQVSLQSVVKNITVIQRMKGFQATMKTLGSTKLKFIVNISITQGDFISTTINYGNGDIDDTSGRWRTRFMNFSTYIYPSPGDFTVMVTATDPLGPPISIFGTVKIYEEVDDVSIIVHGSGCVYTRQSLRVTAIKGTSLQCNFTIFNSAGEIIDTIHRLYNAKDIDGSCYHSLDLNITGLYTVKTIVHNPVSIYSSNKILEITHAANNSTVQVISSPNKHKEMAILQFKVNTDCVLKSCVIFFGDGQSEIVFMVKDDFNLNHIYESGLYEVKISCFVYPAVFINNSNSHLVQRPISFTLFSNPITQCIAYPSAIRIILSDLAGDAIIWFGTLSNRTISIAPEANSDLTEIKIMHEQYGNTGNYSLYINAWNNVSESVIVEGVACIQAPIENVALSVPNYGVYGEIVSFELSQDKGTDVIAVVEFGDSTTSVYEMNDNTTIEIEHTYRIAGVKSYKFHLRNSLGSISKQGDIEIQLRLTNLSVDYQSVLIWPNNLITVNVKLNGQLPSWFKFSLNKDDRFGWNQMKQIYTNTQIAVNNWFPLVTWSYDKPGCYAAEIMIQNAIDILHKVMKIQVLQIIDKLHLDIGNTIYMQEDKYQHIDGDIYLKSSYSLHVHAVLNGASACLFQWSLNTHTTTKNWTTSKNEIEITSLLNQPGRYHLELKVEDHVNDISVSQVFHLLEPISRLQFVAGRDLRAREPSSFAVFLSSVGTNSTIHLSFGDGNTTYYIGDSIWIYGAAFTDFKADESMKLPTNLSNVYVAFINHTYNQEGTYKVHVNVSNLVSSLVSVIDVRVADETCKRPGVEITVGSKECRQLKVRHDQSLTIFSKVNLNCKQREALKFQWSIYQSAGLDQVDCVALAESDKLMSLSDSITTSQSDLTFPSHFLDVGVYIVKLSVELTDLGLSNTDEVFLVVDFVPMVVVIEGGSYRIMPFGEDLELKAVIGNDDGHLYHSAMVYNWQCVLGNGVRDVSLKGTPCFPGSQMLQNYQQKVWLLTDNLIENVEYVFSVNVSDGFQWVHNVQTVVLESGHPPLVELSCISNCRQPINPSQRLILMALCSNCDPRSLPTFAWNLYNTTSLESINLEYGKDTGTPKGYPFLIINAGMLDDESSYTASISVLKLSGLEGRGELKFSTRYPPWGGNCSIAPYEGITLQTRFTVTCTGWQSTDGFLEYHYLVETGQVETMLSWLDFNFTTMENTHQLLAYGSSATKSFFLPSGEAGNNYNVTVSVRTLDSFGAFSEDLMFVKVLPLEDIYSNHSSSSHISLEHQLSNLTSGNDSTLNELIKIGDTQGMVNFVSAASQAVNTATLISDQHESETQEQMKQHRVEIRSALIDAISSVEIRSLDAMKQAADALETTLQIEGEIQPSSQISALDTFDKMSLFLLEESQRTSIGGNAEQLTESSKGLLVGVANVIEAIIHTEDSNDVPMSETSNNNDLKKEMSIKAIDILSNSSGVLLNAKVPGEMPTRIQKESLTMELSKAYRASIGKQNISTMSGGSLNLPSNAHLFADNVGNTSVISMKMLSLPRNPFSWDNDRADSAINSAVTSLSFTTEADEKIDVDDLTIGNEVEISFKNTEINLKSLPVSAPMKKMSIIRVNLMQQSQIFFGKLSSTNALHNNLSVNWYIRIGLPPTRNEYDKTWNYTTLSAHNNTFQKLLLHDGTINDDILYLGITVGESLEENVTTIFYYEFSMFSLVCSYWDEDAEKWRGEGCKVSDKSSTSTTVCLCDHLTWFGSSLFVPPNDLDIEGQLMKFTNLEEYPALLATFCVIVGLYIIAMIWARKRDKQNQKMAMVILEENYDPLHPYQYHLTIYTGHRPHSGTTANVTIVLGGTKADTLPMELRCVGRRLFQRGSIEKFLVSTPIDIGKLRYIRLWHDNFGSSPSWFVSRLTITDLQDKSSVYHIICFQWLSVEIANGSLYGLYYIANEAQLKHFTNVFLSKASQDFSDGHLWFSVLMRPVRSTFTCVQRTSCCLTILLSTMLANAMFYRTVTDTVVGNDVQVGPLHLSWNQLMIGIESAFIVLPLNLLIVLLFRKASGYHPPGSRIINARERLMSFFRFSRMASSAVEDNLSLTQSTFNSHGGSKLSMDFYDNGRQSSIQKISEATLSPQEIMIKVDTILDDMETNAESSSKWPYWCSYIGWLLCVITCAVSGFFTLLYGLSFGKRGQEEWIISFFISVFQDVFVSQPTKVFAVAILFATIMKKKSKKLEKMEADISASESLVDDPQNRARPFLMPSEGLVAKLRAERETEKRTLAVVIEAVVLVIYLLLLLTIAYGHRDPAAYLMTDHVESMLITGKFDKINSIDSFWKWTDEVFLPTVYGNDSTESRDFLNDGIALKLGVSRLRQHRSDFVSCDVRRTIYYNEDRNCVSDYQVFDELTGEYGHDWSSLDRTILNTTYSTTPWIYQSSTDLYGYPVVGDLATYSGGGFVMNLYSDRNQTEDVLTELKTSEWIDRRSRSLFIELSIYNNNANFYTVIMLFLEKTQTGLVKPSYELITTRLDRYSSALSYFLAACEIAVLIITLYYLKLNLKSLRQGFWSYVMDIRNVIDLASIALTWSAFAFVVLRFGVVEWTKRLYAKDRTTFTNFQYAAATDLLYTHQLAFVVFLANLKFLKLLRFNRRMSLLFETLRLAGRDLRYFLVTFLIVFFAFLHSSYLTFMSTTHDYSTLVIASETLISTLLGSFDFETFKASNRVIGPLFFVCFVMLMTLILINMFLSIILSAFARASETMQHEANELELLDFIIKHLRVITGINIKRKHAKYGSDTTLMDMVMNTWDRPDGPVTTKKWLLGDQLCDRLDRLDKMVDRLIIRDALLPHHSLLSVND